MVKPVATIGVFPTVSAAFPQDSPNLRRVSRSETLRYQLLVEKALTLPSNLQGLYPCDFDGDRLDYKATMKLLKTFSQFR